MMLYGLAGKTHGGAKVLTVMSAQGIQAVMTQLTDTPGITVYSGAGRLAQYHEKTTGALDTLIQRYQICVLEKTAWDAKKIELGDSIWH